MTSNQNHKGILPAIGIGMVAGAALSMALTPKKDLKRKAEKALKSVGEVVENITDTMHM